MQTDPNRLFKLFKITFAIAFCVYAVNTLAKIYRGEITGYNVHGIATSAYIDLIIIFVILASFAAYRIIKWIKAKEEKDLIAKYSRRAARRPKNDA